jgi:hypothetical protein
MDMDYLYHVNYEGFKDPDKDRSMLKYEGWDGRPRFDIFYEIGTKGTEFALYTMKEEPTHGLPSAYLIYMTSASEHEAAMKLVGSWSHWKRLITSPRFLTEPRACSTWTGLETWREEKEIKDVAKAYQLLKESAELGNVQAQKEIWKGSPGKKAGRPTKAAIQKPAKEAAEHEESVSQDFKRIKLVASNGNKS